MMVLPARSLLLGLRKGKYKNAWKYPITYQKYFVREITAPKMPTGQTEQDAELYERYGMETPPAQPLSPGENDSMSQWHR